LLDKRDEQTERLVLSEGSRVREIVDDARTGILSVLRKRWMQIRQESGFTSLDPSALEGLAKSEFRRVVTGIPLRRVDL
jgi:hypothetical protein